MNEVKPMGICLGDVVLEEPFIPPNNFCLNKDRIIVVSGSINMNKNSNSSNKGGGREYSKLSHKRLKDYCDFHGYDLFYFNDYIDKNYYVMWQKILALKKVLNNGNHDYAMWIDDDIYITNFSVKIEDFINAEDNRNYCYGDSESNNEGSNDIILSRDIVEKSDLFLNSGTMIIKNSEIGKTFLDKIINGYELFEGYFKENLFHEQTIMTYIYFKEYTNIAKVLPHRVMQSFYKDRIWQPNDFGIHFAGYSIETRNRCMKILDKDKNFVKINNRIYPRNLSIYDICNPELST